MNSGTTAFMYVTVRILLALALRVSVGRFVESCWLRCCAGRVKSFRLLH